MNKQDITIVILLVALLFGWFHMQNKATKARIAAWEKEQAAIAATNVPPRSAISAAGAETASIGAPAAASSGEIGQSDGALIQSATDSADDDEEVDTGKPPMFVTLKNDELSVVLTSKGAAIASAELAGYRASIEKNSPNIVFDYGNTPALSIDGWKGCGRTADFAFVSSSETNAVFSQSLPGGATLIRSFTLAPGYAIEATDTITAASPLSLPESAIAIGELHRHSRGSTSILSVDNLPVQQDGKAKVLHWERKRLLTKLMTGGRAGGGCAGAPDAAQFPPSATERIEGAQKWVALKTRFFAQILEGEWTAFSITAKRSLENGPLSIDAVSGAMIAPALSLAAGESVTRSCRLYIGPKKLSVIRRFSEKSGDIMEFGMWGFLCVILLPLLNFLNLVFRNYGVAIIVLTILVRLIFWPLTRKSNESMKKMGAIQPKIKEIQAKFKDDPQKLQQETMKLYRENHVNPMSSCLPMLIQIPVFIALFVVLRTATELRFAPFLWIRDLSEPENLLAGVIPGVPALNILPFFMAGTMFLQSKLTPSMGDPSQQKMMMWMMPLMMFFMFYSMPSALLLYWSVSQLLAIVQLLRQRRANAAAAPISADGTIDGDALSRQERRRKEREAQRR